MAVDFYLSVPAGSTVAAVIVQILKRDGGLCCVMTEVPTVDFSVAAEWRDVIQLNHSPEAVKRLRNWLRDHPENIVRLYHGTAADLPVLREGLLPTSRSRRRNRQSRSGFVYLSIFPSYARTFAQMGYPRQPTTVYQVELPVRMLCANLEQLANKRLWDGMRVGNSLAESIAIIHGVRVAGAVPLWAIKVLS